MGIDLSSGRLPDRPDGDYRPFLGDPGGGGGGDGDPLSWFRNHPQRFALAIVGLLLLCAFIGLATDRDRWFWLFFFLSAVIYFVWSTPAFLRRRQIIDRWDLVIDGGNGHAEALMGTTRRELGRLDPPAVSIASLDLAPSIWRGWTGDTRAFLVAQNDTNRRIRSYRLFVNVRDYGNALQTSWYLAYLPSAWQRFRGHVGDDLDLFDEQDLRAYVSVVHHALVEAVIELLTTLGRDTDINRTSKGFLGIS